MKNGCIYAKQGDLSDGEVTKFGNLRLSHGACYEAQDYDPLPCLTYTSGGYQPIYACVDDVTNWIYWTNILEDFYYVRMRQMDKDDVLGAQRDSPSEVFYNPGLPDVNEHCQARKDGFTESAGGEGQTVSATEATKIRKCLIQRQFYLRVKQLANSSEHTRYYNWKVKKTADNWLGAWVVGGKQLAIRVLWSRVNSGILSMVAIAECQAFNHRSSAKEACEEHVY